MSDSSQKYNESLEKARAHLDKKEYKNASLMYFQAYNLTENYKDRAIIWAELSWVYYYDKNYEKAIEASENVITHDPEYKAMDDVNRMLGYAYLGLHNLSLAEKYLAQSIALNDTEDKQQFVKYELGKLYFVQGRYDLAYPYFMGISDFFEKKDNTYFLSVLFYLGFINYYLENHEKSRKLFEQILVNNPDNQRKASAFFGLAFLDFREKNFLNVISLCEKIIEYDENFFDKESVGFLTAASYFYLGRKDIFLKYHEEMSASYPKGRYHDEMIALANSEPDVPTTPPAESQ
jgi:tetratricopeptide (TPR) repeat protein